MYWPKETILENEWDQTVRVPPSQHHDLKLYSALEERCVRPPEAKGRYRQKPTCSTRVRVCLEAVGVLPLVGGGRRNRCVLVLVELGGGCCRRRQCCGVRHWGGWQRHYPARSRRQVRWRVHVARGDSATQSETVCTPVVAAQHHQPLPTCIGFIINPKQTWNGLPLSWQLQFYSCARLLFLNENISMPNKYKYK
jgi:hypothetical protein